MDAMTPAPLRAETSAASKRLGSSMLDPAILGPAVGQAFRKLDPRMMWHNPVMFVVEIVSILTTILLLRDLLAGRGHYGFALQINIWLWFTLLFANFAEAVAEGRGKAQAATLRRAKTETTANRLRADGSIEVDRGYRAAPERRRRGGSRRHNPQRRRGDRGRGVGERGGDHR